MLITFGVMALGDNEVIGVFIFWAVLFVWGLAVFLPIIINPFREKLYDKAYNGTMRRMIEFRTWWNGKSAYSKRSLALV